jgi:hypothetical protein
MSLLTYDEARPWARSIKQKVEKRDMPPWFVDRTVGIQKFKEDRSLSDDDIATIVKWVDIGSPHGNPADMPPPRQFDDKVYKWTLGKPDLIVPIPEPITIEPGNPNRWVDVEADSGLTEDRWIKAVETKPSLDGFSVVHHAGTSMQFPGSGDTQALGEYAIGKTGDIFPDGTGLLIKAGTKIVFNMHYASTSVRKVDRTSVGLTFYPKGYVPLHKIVRTAVGPNVDLDLPPGESNIRVDGYTFLDHNIRLTVYQPHLHNRGVRQCLEAIYRDGRVESLSCVKWDFGWHIPYNYSDDAQPLLPKGSVLHIISWFDNSAANKWNPDPRNWSGWGFRSSDDMAFAHMSWFELTDDEYLQQVNVRKGVTSTNGRDQ